LPRRPAKGGTPRNDNFGEFLSVGPKCPSDISCRIAPRCGGHIRPTNCYDCSQYRPLRAGRRPRTGSPAPLGVEQSEAIPSLVKRETKRLLRRYAKGGAPRNDNLREFLTGRLLHHSGLLVLFGPLDSLFDSFLPGFWALGSAYPPDIQSAVAGREVVEILQSFLVRR